jgi:hypothetical protein
MAADGAAISAGAVGSYMFNYVAHANAGQSEKNLKDHWEEIKQTYDKHFDRAKQRYNEFVQHEENAISQQCCPAVCGTAKQEAINAADKANKFWNEMNELIKDGFHQAEADDDQKGQEYGVIPNGAHLQQAFLEAIRERVHDDEGGSGASTDLYHNALYIGYIYAFSNSGISHRLDKINAKLYSAFLQSITPETVTNCTPKTFAWVDFSARIHTVTETVCIQSVRTYKLKTTQMDRQEVQQKLFQARTNGQEAESQSYYAASEYGAACGCKGCVPTPVDCCPGYKEAGDDYMKEARRLMDEAQNDLAQPTRDGLDADHDNRTASSKNASEPWIIKWIMDIQHDRNATTSDFQFHMGSPIKGARGDVDMATAYPPVASQATANWGREGDGKIEGGDASHDSSL